MTRHTTSNGPSSQFEFPTSSAIFPKGVWAPIIHRRRALQYLLQGSSRIRSQLAGRCAAGRTSIVRIPADRASDLQCVVPCEKWPATIGASC